ncbi:high mobility group box domain-containing protein, partial [Circinella umbellata]
MARTKVSKKSMEPKVPRPMNCFLAFRLEKQGQIVDMLPGANHRDISKLLAKLWKELPESEKEPYRERARQAKIEHAQKYPEYKYQPQKRNGRKTRK